MRAEPARIVAAAGKGPAAGEAVAAGHFLDLGAAARWAPGKDAVDRAENLARHGGFKKGRAGAAAIALADAPGGAGVVIGDLAHRVGEFHRGQLAAPQLARLQQTEQPSLG